MLLRNNKKGFTLIELVVASMAMLLLIGSITALLLFFLKWDNNRKEIEKIDNENKIVNNVLFDNLYKYNMTENKILLSNDSSITIYDKNDTIIFNINFSNSELVVNEIKYELEHISDISFTYDKNLLSVKITNTNDKKCSYKYYLLYKKGE